MIILDLFSSINFQSFNALIREKSDSRNVANNNGLSEISGQASGLTAGFLFIFLSEEINFRNSFLVTSAISLFIGIVLILYPYTNERSKNLKNDRENRLSLKYYRKNSKNIFLISMLNFPYIYISIGNFLVPIYLIDVLKGNINDIALSGSLYCIGAITSGLLVPKILKKFREFQSFFITSTIFVLSIIFLPLIFSIPLFVLMRIFTGFGNGGARISRNTLVMNNVESKNIGKFNGGVSITVNFIQLSLLGLFAILIGFIPVYYVFLLYTFVPIFPILFINTTIRKRKFVK
jgi:predicted MFS family arabinose efflux permease